jgi:hypothetical protein
MAQLHHNGSMQKRNSKKTKRSTDPNLLARSVVEEAIGEPLLTGEEITKLATGEGKQEKSLISQIMAEMGRKGGRIGGKRRLKTMTPAARSKVALKAAQARWAKRKIGEGDL